MFRVTDEYIELTRGDSGVLDVEVYDEVTGEVVELGINDRVILSVKKDTKDGYLSFKEKTGVPNNLLRTIYFEKEDTIGLKTGVYWFDIIIKFASGRVATVTKGDKPLPFIILDEAHSYSEEIC